MIEIVGIVAGVIILGSFLLKGEIKIRIVNSLGAALLIVYGAIIEAWSVMALNAALMLVHIYYLIRTPRKKSHPRTPTPKSEGTGAGGE